MGRAIKDESIGTTGQYIETSDGGYRHLIPAHRLLSDKMKTSSSGIQL
jgi:hypothetical protein